MSAVLQALAEQLGREAVSIGDAIGAKHYVDFSGELPARPIALVRPVDTPQVAAILAICHAHRQPVVVQGGMTGLAGGATPRPGEIALSLERLTGIEELDPLSATAIVRAGTPLQSVQDAAADAGLSFPLDLGARGSCTIGGNIATNAGGNQVLRFGMMRNLVLGLEAVLADGTIVSSMNRMLKNNAGYDLKQLFIGTEGTLGIVTRAVLRLHPKLPTKSTALLAAPGFEAALVLLRTLQAELAGGLSAFEAMWASYFEHVIAEIDAIRSPFAEPHPMYLLVETEGRDENEDRARLERALGAAFEAGIVTDAVVAQSERERRDFWGIRDAIGEVTARLQPMLAFDVSMPHGEMPAFLTRVERELDASFPGAINLVFGHLGDGNLHLTMTTGRAADLPALSRIVYEAAGAHAGSIAAEHGIGQLKREYLSLSRTRSEIELMARLKAALDPHGILNPARVIP